MVYCLFVHKSSYMTVYLSYLTVTFKLKVKKVLKTVFDLYLRIAVKLCFVAKVSAKSLGRDSLLSEKVKGRTVKHSNELC